MTEVLSQVEIDALLGGMDNNALMYVPEALKTTELCLEAVRHNANALKHVPEKLKTLELCLEAVRHDGK